MAEAIFRQHAGQQPYAPTGSGGAKSGDIIQLGDDRAAVVKTDLAQHELGAVYTEGLFEVPCAAATEFAVGANVNWNNATKLAVSTTGSGIFPLGTAVKAVNDAQTTVLVDINNTKA